MNSTDYLFLVTGMMLVTYIPRALPAFLVGRLHLSAKMEKFLQLIPYTAMISLVFPGILSVDPRHAWIGLAGGAVSALLAWKKVPMIVCVLAAIATVWICVLLV